MKPKHSKKWYKKNIDLEDSSEIGAGNLLSDSEKRSDYLSWDEYFIGVALLSSMRSKDPSTRNGACIVDEDNKIVGTGYNGMPHYCDDDVFPWDRKNKYAYVVHAETNAILNCRNLPKRCRLYLYSDKGYYPCCECAKNIIQSNISEIIMAFAINSNTDKYDWQPTKKMFQAAGIKIRDLRWEKSSDGYLERIKKLSQNV